MRDLIRAIKAWIAMVAGLLNPVYDRLVSGVKIWWQLIVLGGLQVAGDILAAATPALQPIVAAFVNAFETSGAPLADQVKAPISALASGAFNTSAANLTAQGPSTPDNALATAAAAFAEAFGFGISSAAVTAAFEAAFPEKLNVLNGVGPMLAQMAGFEEVAKAVLGPLYDAAFGKSLDYHFRSVFKPELPSEGDAVTWHSRRLITDAQLSTLFGYSGLKAEYEAPFVASAYRPVQPFLLARAAEAGAIPASDLTAILQFDGFRDEDITRLMAAFVALALVPYQQQYLVAAVRSTELGTMTPAELGDVMTSINLTQDQQALVQLTVATRKLEQLAELYRKSISEGYGYGTITDQQYVPMLEAIGIGEADAEAHYAVDSVKKIGKAAIVAERAAARLANQQNRAAQKAAVTAFRTGSIDAAGLTAALLAAQMDPEVAGFTVAIEQTKQLGPLTFIYGVELPRRSALVLREKVTALGVQVKAQLVTPADALTTLAGLGIPADNAQALVADWASSHITASDVGVKLPL